MTQYTAVDLMWKLLEYMCRQMSASVMSRSLCLWVSLVALYLPRRSCQCRSLIERIVSRLPLSRPLRPCLSLSQGMLCNFGPLLPPRDDVAVVSYDLRKDVRKLGCPVRKFLVAIGDFLLKCLCTFSSETQRSAHAPCLRRSHLDSYRTTDTQTLGAIGRKI